MSIDNTATLPTESASDEKQPGATEQPSFSESIQELEAILQRVDSDTTDIDRLADELGRATELLEMCRGKIRKAEVEVNQIVQKLSGS